MLSSIISKNQYAVSFSFASFYFIGDIPTNCSDSGTELAPILCKEHRVDEEFSSPSNIRSMTVTNCACEVGYNKAKLCDTCFRPFIDKSNVLTYPDDKIKLDPSSSSITISSNVAVIYKFRQANFVKRSLESMDRGITQFNARFVSDKMMQSLRSKLISSALYKKLSLVTWPKMNKPSRDSKERVGRRYLYDSRPLTAPVIDRVTASLGEKMMHSNYPMAVNTRLQHMDLVSDDSMKADVEVFRVLIFSPMTPTMRKPTQFRRSQLAISSWLRLNSLHPLLKARTILFGDSFTECLAILENFNAEDELDHITNSTNNRCKEDKYTSDIKEVIDCVPITECLHFEFGIPTLDCMFQKALTVSMPGEYLMFVNSDISFGSDFVHTGKSLTTCFVCIEF